MNRQQRRHEKRQSKKYHSNKNLIQEIEIEAFKPDFDKFDQSTPLLSKMIATFKAQKGLNEFFNTITDEELDLIFEHINKRNENPELEDVEITIKDTDWRINQDLIGCAIHLEAFKNKTPTLIIDTDTIIEKESLFEHNLHFLKIFRLNVFDLFDVPDDWNYEEIKFIMNKDFFERYRDLQAKGLISK